MEIPVLIEPVAGNGYRARGVEPFALSAEGATPDAALQNLAEAIREHMPAGARFASLQLPAPEHPLAEFAGMLRDDPLYDAWRQAVEEYRRERDKEEGLP